MITLVDRLVSPIEPHAEISHNPLGKISRLVIDGHPLYDSRVICEYLCHRAGDKTLLPDEPVRALPHPDPAGAGSGNGRGGSGLAL